MEQLGFRELVAQENLKQETADRVDFLSAVSETIVTAAYCLFFLRQFMISTASTSIRIKIPTASTI